jgi:uncharacterized protein
VIRRAKGLFADLGATVEVRNEARVHLWYEARFGVPGVPFSSSTDAIDHFASTTCCFGVSRTTDGQLIDYAPHGYADLFAMRVRPNPRLAPREVYEAKTRRWQQEWPVWSWIPGSSLRTGPGRTAYRPRGGDAGRGSTRPQLIQLRRRRRHWPVTRN